MAISGIIFIVIKNVLNKEMQQEGKILLDF